MNYKRIVPVVAKCAVLCAILIVGACEPYVCTDGNLISTTSGVNSGVACATPCDNGTVAPGETAEKCAVCDHGFILNASQQCLQALISVDNVVDTGDLELDGASSVATAVVGSATYLFVAAGIDDGVSVFSVGADGKLASVDNVTDDADLELEGANSVATAVVEGTTYLFVAGWLDAGISVFSVGTDGKLTSVQNIADNDDLELHGAYSTATAVVGGTTYLFVAANWDDGINVFSVGADGALTSVQTIDDNDDLLLDGAASFATATIGDTTYLFVAAVFDNGVSVFSVGADGKLALLDQIADDADLVLRGASSLVTAVIGSTAYLFVAGGYDDGINVFSIGDEGKLTYVHHIVDTDDMALNGPFSITAAVGAGDVTYLFAAANSENGVSVLSVGADGMLAPVASVIDNGTLQLQRASSVTAAVIGSATYLFVAGGRDDGVSVFAFNN